MAGDPAAGAAVITALVLVSLLVVLLLLPLLVLDAVADFAVSMIELGEVTGAFYRVAPERDLSAQGDGSWSAGVSSEN